MRFFLVYFQAVGYSKNVFQICTLILFYLRGPVVRFVLFFRQWLPRNKLEPLGVDSGLDRAKLLENKKPNVRKAVRKAYEKAIMHRCRVTGEPNPLSGESGTDE